MNDEEKWLKKEYGQICTLPFLLESFEHLDDTTALDKEISFQAENVKNTGLTVQARGLKNEATPLVKEDDAGCLLGFN